jgi:hypothetical protein
MDGWPQRLNAFSVPGKRNLEVKNACRIIYGVMMVVTWVTYPCHGKHIALIGAYQAPSRRCLFEADR